MRRVGDMKPLIIIRILFQFCFGWFVRSRVGIEGAKDTNGLVTHILVPSPPIYFWGNHFFTGAAGLKWVCHWKGWKRSKMVPTEVSHSTQEISQSSSFYSLWRLVTSKYFAHATRCGNTRQGSPVEIVKSNEFWNSFVFSVIQNCMIFCLDALDACSPSKVGITNHSCDSLEPTRSGQSWGASGQSSTFSCAAARSLTQHEAFGGDDLWHRSSDQCDHFTMVEIVKKFGLS